MNQCAWITAFAIPRFPRHSLPNGRARCAPRSSTDWPPVSQSTDNEVGALLCCPTQIDRPTICQLDRNKEGLLVSLQCPSLHFGAEAFRSGCTVGRRSQTSTWPFAERRRRRRTRRLVCFNKRLQRQLQEMRPLMGSEQTQRLRRALRVCPPRKGTLEKK